MKNYAKLEKEILNLLKMKVTLLERHKYKKARETMDIIDIRISSKIAALEALEETAEFPVDGDIPGFWVPTDTVDD